MADILDKEMYSYFIRLNEAEKKSIVQMLKAFMNGRKKNSGRISIEQYNKEIDEAMAEFEKGEAMTHDEVVKTSRDW